MVSPPVPPFYYTFKVDELVNFYNDIANASDKPFVVYNMPKFSWCCHYTGSYVQTEEESKHPRAQVYTQ